MTETELAKTLSFNLKKYRGNNFTQESLSEKANLSVQLINGIEGCRKWVSRKSLVKIAEALNIEVYQLFIPQDTTQIVIEKTPENEKIRSQITDEIVNEVRDSVNRVLDKIKD